MQETRPQHGRDPLEALAERVAAALLPGVLERSSDLAGALGRLTFDLEGTHDVHEAWAERELASLRERSFAGGWWLAVLTSALGSDGLGARREKRGLQGLDEVLRPAAERRDTELAWSEAADDLAPEFLDGWQLPFLVAAACVLALEHAGESLSIDVAGRAVELQGAGWNEVEVQRAALAGALEPALAAVPGSLLEAIRPKAGGSASLRLTLPPEGF